MAASKLDVKVPDNRMHVVVSRCSERERSLQQRSGIANLRRAQHKALAQCKWQLILTVNDASSLDIVRMSMDLMTVALVQICSGSTTSTRGSCGAHSMTTFMVEA